MKGKPKNLNRGLDCDVIVAVSSFESRTLKSQPSTPLCPFNKLKIQACSPRPSNFLPPFHNGARALVVCILVVLKSK
jgi:hypothetical protein